MRTTPNKVIALATAIVTGVGILFSLFFVIQIWRLKRPITTNIQSSLNKSSALVVNTRQGLDIVDQVVQNVYTSTSTLEDSTKTLIKTIDNTNQFIDSVSTFMGDSLVNTITNTQTAINSAQASAVVIDNLLTTLSKVPFIGINYNPTQPLNVALGEVSDSLDPLQSTLTSFQTELETTQTNIRRMRDQVIILDQNITDINRNLKATQLVIINYQSQLDTFDNSLFKAYTSIPKWVNAAAWILTLLILWIIFIQVSILLLAINLVTETNFRITETVPNE